MARRRGTPRSSAVTRLPRRAWRKHRGDRSLQFSSPNYNIAKMGFTSFGGHRSRGSLGLWGVSVAPRKRRRVLSPQSTTTQWCRRPSRQPGPCDDAAPGGCVVTDLRAGCDVCPTIALTTTREVTVITRSTTSVKVHVWNVYRQHGIREALAGTPTAQPRSKRPAATTIRSTAVSTVARRATPPKVTSSVVARNIVRPRWRACPRSL